jgi:predicted amidohydrolase
MSKTLKLTVVQCPLAWEDKQTNLDYFSKTLSSLEKTNLVILPEMFTTGFTMNTSLAEDMDGDAVRWMVKQAAQLNAAVTGSLIIRENNKTYNRLVFVTPDGKVSYYNKRHLFTMAGEQNHYGAGSEKCIVDYKGWNIALFVCYDLRFPVWSRNVLSNGEPSYDLALYVANWPEKRSHAWKTLLQARAIENVCYVAGVNRVGVDGKENVYSGDSLIVDFKGEVLVQDEAQKPFTRSVELDKDALIEFRKVFPSLLDADEFRFKQEEQ